LNAGLQAGFHAPSYWTTIPSAISCWALIVDNLMRFSWTGAQGLGLITGHIRRWHGLAGCSRIGGVLSQARSGDRSNRNG
jgi:hypothetical protein